MMMALWLPGWKRVALIDRVNSRDCLGHAQRGPACTAVRRGQPALSSSSPARHAQLSVSCCCWVYLTHVQQDLKPFLFDVGIKGNLVRFKDDEAPLPWDHRLLACRLCSVASLWECISFAFTNQLRIADCPFKWVTKSELVGYKPDWLYKKKHKYLNYFT